MSEIENFRKTVESIRSNWELAAADRSLAATALTEAKNRESALYRSWREMTQALNDWEGEEKDCAHKFVTGPSGRGMGFDEQCSKCGHFKNAFPAC